MLKSHINTSLGLLFGIFFIVSSCSNENNESNLPSDLVDQNDSINSVTVDVDMDVVEGENELEFGDIYSEDFYALFEFSFEQQYDFGWRYIESNYEEYALDPLREMTDYDAKNDLALIQNIKTVNDQGEIEMHPVEFQGYSHSKKYLNGNYIFVTYMLKEISQEFHYYYVDVNDGFKVLKEGTLAENGGDEGSWYHSYGEFSKDNSVYQHIYAEGEGLDTNDVWTDVIYFN